MPRPFTHETAVINAKKSWEPASKRFLPPPEPEQKPEPSQPALIDSYVAGSLSRVRKQLSMLLDTLDGAIAGTVQQLDRKNQLQIIDPQGIDRLSNSVSRLSELERQLAGRPLPGSFRPQSDKPSKRSNRPVEVWSEPTQPSTVQSVPVPPHIGPENG